MQHHHSHRRMRAPFALRHLFLPKQMRKNTPETQESGQMTIEFVIMFPVMLLIALIACNSILFLSECASFDRIFRESVCVQAPSPASGQNTDRTAAYVLSALDSFQAKPYLSCSTTSATQADGLSTYEGTLQFTPTIFGAYPLRSVFGITLPPIEHKIQIRVDTYKPGVFL